MHWSAVLCLDIYALILNQHFSWLGRRQGWGRRVQSCQD